MKVTVLPYWFATLRMMYLYIIMLSADFTSVSNSLVDLALPAGGHFMVMALDAQSAFHHGLHHFAAQILVMISRRDREVAFFIARPVA